MKTQITTDLGTPKILIEKRKQLEELEKFITDSSSQFNEREEALRVVLLEYKINIEKIEAKFEIYPNREWYRIYIVTSDAKLERMSKKRKEQLLSVLKTNTELDIYFGDDIFFKKNTIRIDFFRCI